MSGMPCQDCSGVLVTSGFAVAAVSDGHGGERYFRSGEGSRMAVRVALDLIGEYLSAEDAAARLRKDPDTFIERMTKSILASWYLAVDDYDRAHPLSLKEAEIDSRHGGDPMSRYGATLIAGALGEGFALGIQIGDGCLAAIGRGGEDSIPVPEDPDCFMNVTTSLCQAEPLERFRHWYVDEDVPMALVLASDGVTNTFEDGPAFLRYCRTASCFALGDGIWDRLMSRTKGRADRSSRDDVSIAVVCTDCPEMRALRESIDRGYEESDLRNAPHAAVSRGEAVCGDMRFRILGDGRLRMTSYSGSDPGEFLIPDRVCVGGSVMKVAEIGSRCFVKRRVSAVVIPATVETVHPKAFYKCQGLRSVEVMGDASLSPNSFFSCNRLEGPMMEFRRPLERSLLRKHLHEFEEVPFHLPERGDVHALLGRVRPDDGRPDRYRRHARMLGFYDAGLQPSVDSGYPGLAPHGPAIDFGGGYHYRCILRLQPSGERFLVFYLRPFERSGYPRDQVFQRLVIGAAWFHYSLNYLCAAGDYSNVGRRPHSVPV